MEKEETGETWVTSTLGEGEINQAHGQPWEHPIQPTIIIFHWINQGEGVPLNMLTTYRIQKVQN